MEVDGLKLFMLVVDMIVIGLITYSTKSKNRIQWKIAGIVFFSIDFLIALLGLMGTINLT